MAGFTTKVSTYLRPVGEAPGTSYLVVEDPLEVVLIDTPNVLSVKQGSSAVVFDNKVVSHSGAGYMRFNTYPGGVTPVLNYSIKLEKAGLIKIRIRMRTNRPSGSEPLNIKIYLDDNKLIDDSSIDLPGNSWLWVNLAINGDIVVPDKEIHTLGISIVGEDGAEIYLDAISVSTGEYDQGTFDENSPGFTSPPYITLHAKVYELDNDNLPTNELPIYDNKNTLENITIDDWYNFSTGVLSNNPTISTSETIGFFLFSSEKLDDHYVIWDLAKEDLDPYDPVVFLTPTVTFDSDTQLWSLVRNNNLAIRSWSFRDSFDADNCKINTPPSELQTKIDNDFSDLLGEPVFLNTDIAGNDGNEKVELKLPDRVVSLLIDQSGSMTWNDSEGTRLELSRRMINRVDSTYPGDVKWNVYSFEGTPIRVNFFAVIEDASINTNDINDVASTFFSDQESGYAGIRIVRKTGGFPKNAIDGDIVQEGFFDRSFDDNLTEDVEYFYKIFTFDEDGTFSQGVEIQATPRIRDIPTGVAQFTANVLKGSGPVLEDDALGMWHFDESVGSVTYDFTQNQKHLVWGGDDDEPIWLNPVDVPSGRSGARMSGKTFKTTRDSFSVSDNDNKFNSNKMTFMGWFYIQSNGEVGNALCSRADGTTGKVSYFLGVSGTGNLFIVTHNPSIETVSTVDTIPFNEWVHISVTADFGTNTIKFYLNGSQMTNGATGSLAPFPLVGDNKIFSVGSVTSTFFNNTLFGKISDFAVYNVIKSDSFISDAAFLTEDFNEKINDNGDRLLLLNYSIPENFDFPGGNVRIVEKHSAGAIDYSYTGEVDERGDLIREFNGFGLEPFHENDGITVFDEVVSSGAFVLSLQREFVHGRTYHYKIFSRNSIGNYSNWTDSPVISAEIPFFDEDEQKNAAKRNLAVGSPSPSLNPITGVTQKIGNRKNYIKWVVPIIDERHVQTHVYYSNSSFPVFDDKGIAASNVELIFSGKETQTEFVHRNIENDVTAFYAIVSVDKYGNKSTPFYFQETPLATANEVGIPLLEIKKARYELVNENSLSLQWEQPVRFQKNINAWFDQRIALFAQITDEFGAPLADDSRLRFEADAGTTSAGLAENVFGETVNRSSFTPTPEETFILTSTPQGNGILKGIIRMSPDFNIISAIEKLFLTVKIIFSVPDKESPSQDAFRFVSLPITVTMNNPFKMEISNFSRDRITHLCKKEVPLNSFEFIATGGLGFNPNEEKDFDGTFIRKSAPFVARVKVLYRDKPIRIGGNTFVSVHEASDPQCDNLDIIPVEPFRPSFSNRKSKEVLPPATTLDVQLGFEDDGKGNLTEISFTDIPLQAPDRPQGIMLFAQSTFNGFVGRKRMYIAFESTLRVELTINEPDSNCVDVGEQYAQCYLIDPDSPNPKNPRKTKIPDNEICKWNLQRGPGGRDRPFYSLDNVPIASGIFSFIRNNTARKVFFGPACGVTWTIIDLGPAKGGPALVPEMYAVKASVTFDGLSAFEERPLILFPQQAPGSFGSRMLMSFPQLVNSMWADGYDFETLKISRDPNTSTIPFSSQFRSCSSSFNGTLFILNFGQLVEIETGDEFEILHGDSISIDLDEEIDEFVFTGAEEDKAFASFPLSEDDDTTNVYLRINSFIGPPVKDTASSNSSFTNICSSINLPTGLKKEPEDRAIVGRTTVLLDGETRFLNGGGGFDNGIPPTVIRLKEPLKVSIIDTRRDNVPVKEVLVDGQSNHTFIVEVTFKGKPVPNGTPVSLTVAGKNPSKITLINSVVFTFQQDDPFLTGGVRSLASFTILPLNPVESFSAQVQAESTYDKRGDAERSMTACVTIRYDSVQTDTDKTATTDVVKEKGIVNNVFNAGISIYDADLNTWEDKAPMEFPRGGLSLSYTITPYGAALHAIGGVDGNNISGRNEQYLIGIDAWTEFASIPTPRMLHVSTEDAGKIYVFGGLTIEDGNLTVSNKLEIYDVFTDTWSVGSEMPEISGTTYGTSLSSIVKQDDFIYIIGGLIEVDSQGGIRAFNDRILVYNILTDSWNYSDKFIDQDYEIYHRISPFAFLDDFDGGTPTIVVAGGSILVGEGKNQALEFPTDTISFDPLHINSITIHDSSFGDIPRPRYKGGISVIETGPNEGAYVLGGANKKSSTLRLFEKVSVAVSSPPRLEITKLEENPISRQSFGMATDGDQFIYVAGGVTSGRPPGFLHIGANAEPKTARLDGRQSVAINIELKDDAGEIPTAAIRVLVRGFLVFPGNKSNDSAGAQESSSGSDQAQKQAADEVSRQSFVYPVVFSSNNFKISGGFGTTTMLPRSDDILKKINDIKNKLGINENVAGEGTQEDVLLIEEGTVRNPYQIRIQVTVVDDFFYGQTIVDIQDNEDPDVIATDTTAATDTATDTTTTTDTSNSIIILEGCIGFSASRELPADDTVDVDVEETTTSQLTDQPITDGLDDTSLLFDLNPTQAAQLQSPSIQYFSDIEWIPQVISHLSGNTGAAADALRIISRLDNAIPFGASPYFDGIVSITSDLLKDSADGRVKTIYSHTDNEENLSFSTKTEAIEDVQAIDGFGKTPVVINNFSIVFPVTLSALVARTDTDSLEEIAKETGGQSQTVLDALFIDDILNNTLGRVAGSIGYGIYEKTVDLGVDGVVHSISLDYELFPNTDGNWQVSSSIDGFNFSNFSDKFNPDEEVEFFRLSGRYFRFRSTLLSGLSSSVEEVYEEVATPGIPSLTDININYSVPKESFIFLDCEDPDFSAQQIAIAIKANSPPSSFIEVGASTTTSYNWDDYQTGSQPSVPQFGKIYIPIRTDQNDPALNEPMENIDGFVFRAEYGRWSPSSKVTVKNSSGTIIEDSEYKSYPRNGLIVFNTKKFDSYIIDIENAGKLCLGIKITNKFSVEPISIEGVGYFYNTNVFLPAPLAERPPEALNPRILPSTPTIYSTVSATYKFFDLNLDQEDLDQTDIRWHINGVEIEYLRGLTEWNNINDFADPVWIYSFGFQPEDVPSGTTIEQFARERGESIINVGDVIYFTVKPSDGKVFGTTSRSPSVAVISAPPFITTLLIRGRTSSGVEQDDVTTATTAFADFNFFDDGGDNVSTIIWFVNGVEFKRGSLNNSTNGFNNNEIVPGELRTNTGTLALSIANNLQVEVRPASGSILGNPAKSPTITVQNSPPVVTVVTVGPENPTSSSNLEVTFAFFDQDINTGNTEQNNQSSIRWFRKSSSSGQFEEVTSIANQDIASNLLTSSGDKWYAEVIPFDGISVGATVRSNTVTIQ